MPSTCEACLQQVFCAGLILPHGEVIDFADSGDVVDQPEWLNTNHDVAVKFILLHHVRDV